MGKKSVRLAVDAEQRATKWNLLGHFSREKTLQPMTN
jgi:hypothetical protein